MSVERERRERKVYMSLYISPELKRTIDQLRGPISRSLFAEYLMWQGLKVLKERITGVLRKEPELSELLKRSKRLPRVARTT